MGGAGSRPEREQQGARHPSGPEEKARRLQAWFEDRAPVLVAYSGGVDSALVAVAARRTLGAEEVLAVIADSPSLPRRELREARRFAAEHDVPLRAVPTREGEREGYVANRGDRCYFCKHELYSVLRDTFAAGGWKTVVDGTNAADAGEHRPGRRAADELDVESPLLACGMDKEDVRAVSRMWGLETWDKPALACLASRIPYGTEVTPERLRQVERAEEVLWEEGFQVFRVRHHGELARIEVAEQERGRFAEPGLRTRVFDGVREAGFTHVALDLQPYRSGRLNEALEGEGGV